MHFEEPTFPHPVGFCIYCGGTDRLQDEHVVPYGLSGECLLTRASCPACADVTSAFEHDVLRNAFPVLRAKLGLRTRRKRERPTEFPVLLRTAGSRVEVTLPVSAHPGSVFFPKYPPAAHLTGATYAEGIGLSGGSILHLEKARLRELARAHQADGVVLRTTYKPAAFARLVAKVGYAFTVACVPLTDFEVVYPVPTILGRSNKTGRWVGAGLGTPVNGPEGLHAVSLVPTGRDLVAYVRLFAQFGAPEYHVVVGRLRSLAHTAA